MNTMNYTMFYISMKYSLVKKIRTNVGNMTKVLSDHPTMVSKLSTLDILKFGKNYWSKVTI